MHREKNLKIFSIPRPKIFFRLSAVHLTKSQSHSRTHAPRPNQSVEPYFQPQKPWINSALRIHNSALEKAPVQNEAIHAVPRNTPFRKFPRNTHFRFSIFDFYISAFGVLASLATAEPIGEAGWRFNVLPVGSRQNIYSHNFRVSLIPDPWPLSPIRSIGVNISPMISWETYV